MLRSEEVLEQICQMTGCSREQVRAVVGLAMEALHRVAFCDDGAVTASIMECMWMFGDKACYHLGGILEVARIEEDHDLPWYETYARFAPETLTKFDPLLETWMEQRSPGRKARDRG
jgi:hypothetical protein